MGIMKCTNALQATQSLGFAIFTETDCHDWVLLMILELTFDIIQADVHVHNL